MKQIKTIDGLILNDSKNYIEEIVHRGAIEKISPFMAYYMHYKFPLVFGEEIVLLNR